ncbi:unnamed protein product [Anisakis simplex]|uniref:Protein sprint (inferred by orthology to a D. melanogaster protein) n=1 Tax=Anisakis simplex TaxID=6269 RepID=A0A0M3KFS2_ANISI|nr:unnamed protein product [Anisakis simplex]
MSSCLEEPIAEEEYDDEIACSLETSSDGDADDEHLHKCLASEDDSTEYGTMTLRKRNGFCPEKISENHRELQTRREVAIVERVEGDFVENVFSSNGKDAISKSPSVNGTANHKDDVCINSLLNMSSNTETISSGTHTLCSRKTLNSHSLPRTHPRCYTHENPLFESLDDIPSSIRAISPVISPPRLRGGFCLDPGTKIQEYVERENHLQTVSIKRLVSSSHIRFQVRLSAQENTVFGATLRRFIECTIEGEESDPQVLSTCHISLIFCFLSVYELITRSNRYFLS